jgi:hypothetical protein
MANAWSERHPMKRPRSHGLIVSKVLASGDVLLQRKSGKSFSVTHVLISKLSKTTFI